MSAVAAHNRIHGGASIVQARDRTRSKADGACWPRLIFVRACFLLIGNGLSFAGLYASIMRSETSVVFMGMGVLYWGEEGGVLGVGRKGFKKVVGRKTHNSVGSKVMFWVGIQVSRWGRS